MTMCRQNTCDKYHMNTDNDFLLFSFIFLLLFRKFVNLCKFVNSMNKSIYNSVYVPSLILSSNTREVLVYNNGDHFEMESRKI